MEGILGGQLPPGLAGYVLSQNQQGQQQAQQMQMLQGILGLQGAAEDRGMKQQLFPLQLQEHQAKIKKMEQEAAMNEQLAPLLANPNISPDMLDALGTKLALGGHPGAATVMNIADKRRQQVLNQQGIASMQSSPDKTIMPDPQEAQQSADYGTPPVNPVNVPGAPGILGPLLNSPHVGPAANALQGVINQGAPGQNPQQVMQHMDRLTQLHATAENQRATQAAINARQDKAQVNRIEIRNMFPPGATGSGVTAVPAGSANLAGEEFLKSLPPATATLIKRVADGSIPLTNFSTKGGHREQIATMAAQYDPTFNTQRSGVLKDFTSGKSAMNVTAINTAIGHMDTLDQLGSALQNNNSQDVNRLVNNISSRLGKPEVNNYDLARTAVGDELMRVFRQVGASQQEADAWKAKFDSANSPEKIKGSVKTAAELLRSRIDAIDDQYKRGMGSEKGYPNLLSPKSTDVMSRLSGTQQRRATDNAPAVNAKGWKLMTDKNGNKAYVGPNKEVEEVR